MFSLGRSGENLNQLYLLIQVLVSFFLALKMKSINQLAQNEVN